MIATTPDKSPFDLLLDIDEKCRSMACGLPIQEEFREEWRGIAFKLKESTFLAPMTEVSEVISSLPMTAVPGVKSWVLGIANMRGTLLPVMDLQGLIYGKNTMSDYLYQRIMVTNIGGIAAGFRVDTILGIKHFWVDEIVEDLPNLDAPVRPYIVSSCKREQELHGIFSLDKLLHSQAFTDVAI